MSNSANLCPKCQSPVKEKDVICLACGTSLKSLQGKSRIVESPKARVISAVAAPLGMASPADSLKKLLSLLLAFLVFCLSALFAWIYFKDFHGFYNVTDVLLMQNRLGLCEKVYSGLESLALSADLEELSFYKQQVQKEMSAATDSKNEAALEMRVADHYVDSRGLHIQLSIKNKTPFQLLLYDRYFYLKTDSGLFPAYFPGDAENIGPFKLGAKKRANGGIVFKGLGLLSGTGKTFDGKIVFNDGKKYATSDLHLDLSPSKPQKTEGWALVSPQNSKATGKG